MDAVTATIPGLVKQCWQSGLDLLFPPRCAGCGRSGTVWCPSCDDCLIKLRARICPLCGGRLPRSGICSNCTRNPLPLRVRSYALYEGPLVRALLKLKYRPNRRLAEEMAVWLKRLIEREGWSASMVVAVPLSVSRLRQRGYNQVALIASALARMLELPHDAKALRRIRDTPSQVGLNPTERWNNVSGAFRSYLSNGSSQTVLLVDDLFTTGATMAACASALKASGVKNLIGLTVARAR
jgi:ComF family protein